MSRTSPRRFGHAEIHLRQPHTTGGCEVMTIRNPIGRLRRQELKTGTRIRSSRVQPTAGTILDAVFGAPEGDTWFCDLGTAYRRRRSA